MTTDQTVMETGIAKKTVQNAFSALRAARKIERAETRNRLAYYRYRDPRSEQPEPADDEHQRPAFDPF